MNSKCMKNVKSVVFKAIAVFIIFLSYQLQVNAATIESTATGGVWATGSTWVGGVAPTATDSVVISTTGGNSVSLGAPASCLTLTINFDGILNSGTFLLTISGNFTRVGTLTSTTGGVTFAGTATQIISGFTTTGTVSMTKTGGVATFVGNVNAAALTINGTGGTLNLGSGRTHTFTGNITLTNGTLQGGSSTLHVSASTVTAWTGTGSNFVAGTSTVVFNGVNQTINTTTTFNNLTLGGTGGKTFAALTTTTINGILTIENQSNANTFSGAIAYGASATLRYNVGAINRTVSNEWPATFLGTGGVIIDGTSPGTITLDANKTMGNNTNVPLRINAGGTLATSTRSITFHGDFINSGTLNSGAAVVIAGTVATQNIASFTTTSTLTMSKTSGTATLTGNLNATGLTINGVGGTLDLGSSTHTINGSIALTNGTLLGSTSTLGIAGDLTGGATFTGNACNILLQNNNAQSINGFTTTGNVTSNKTGNTATFTGNVNANNLTINNTGSGTLNLGVGRTHTFTGTITRTFGTLAFSSSTLILTRTGTVITGNGGTINFGTGTLILAGAAQTIDNPLTYHNLTLAGSGSKTFSGASHVINGTLSVENGSNANSFSTPPTFGSTAALVYNAGASNRTVGGEWISPMLSTGGVTIGGTGIITLNAAKVLGNNTQIPLTINAGATLATANHAISFHGNFVNNGTFTAGSSPITLTGSGNQSIAGFTTTGLVTMNKTGFTTTMQGNINAGGLTINGGGGTLNLGTSLTHTFTGAITLTAGNLNAGSSTINANFTGAVWIGTGSLFVAGTSTVNFGGGAQSITSSQTTFNNVTFSGSGTKTFTNSPIVNGIVSMEGTADVVVTGAGVITYGPNATLIYNKVGAFTTTLEEFPSPFAAAGGVIIANTGTITLNAAKNITYKLNINTGATLNLGVGLTHNCRGLIRGAGSAEAGTFGGTTSGAATIDPTFFATATGTIVSSSPVATWTGLGTTDWELGTNWLEGSKPNSDMDAIIPAGGVQPTLTAAAVVKNLTIDVGATLTTAGFQLTLNGDFINNGTATLSNSPIVLAGTLTQNIAGFTTTGSVSSTKTASVATLLGNISTSSITISNAGTLNLGASLTHTVTGDLTMNSNGLNGGTSTLILSGNINGAGTLIGASMNLTLAGTAAQSINGFSTTGTLLMTKTAETATLAANINAGALTLNGVGGTLNLGTSRTHTFTGNITLTNGTLHGGTNTILNANASTTTAWTGNGANFIAGTSTVVFGGNVQTINTTTIFYNLELNGNGGKTFANGTTTTINGTHSIKNRSQVNTFTGATLVYGPSAGIYYDTQNVPRTASDEWPSVFNSTGGISMAGTNTQITLNAPRTLGNNVPILVTGNANLITSTHLLTVGGNLTNSASTISIGAGGITITGTANQSIAGFTTTGSVTMTKTAGTATFTSNLSTTNLTLNGVGGTLNLGAGLTHTISGNLTVTNGTLVGNTANVTLAGTTAQSIAGFTTTGTISMTKTALTATFTGNVSAGALTLNGLGGTLNLGVGLTHTFSGLWTRTNGTLNGGSSTVNFTRTGAVVSGSGGTFTSNTGTVNYAGANQTVAELTYNNLTLSNSGVKTTSTSVIVNKIFSLEGTATVSAPFTYGGESTLRYNKGASYTTTTNEFPATFSGTGGVVNAGVGIITFDGNKTIEAALTINTGCQVNLGSFTGHSSKGLTLGGVIQAIGSYGGTTSLATNINATFFETATGQIEVTNPLAIWLGLTSDWFTPANWAGGEVPSSVLDVVINSGTPQQPVLTGNVVTADLTINSGATLTSAGFQLTIFGDFTPTGTATLSSSPIVIAGIFNQNIGAFTTTGNVSMTKTAGTATFTSNVTMSDLTLNGVGGTLNLGAGLTHTISGNLTVTNGTLVANTANITLAGTATQNIAGFTTTGTITSTKTAGTATFTGNMSVGALTLNGIGGGVNLGLALTHTFTGNITLTAGLLTGNTANIILTGAAAQNIAGFTTTGTITSTKTGGTATFTGNIGASSLTTSVAGGTVNLGVGLTHTITGNTAVTLGILNGGSSTLILSGNLTGGGTLTGTGMNLTLAGTGAQSIVGFSTTGTITSTKTGGTATFTGDIGAAAALTINGAGGTVNLGVSRTHIINAITVTSGTLNGATSTLTLSGNLTNAGTLTGTSMNLTLSGTGAQSIAGFTTTGTLSMIKTAGGIATLTGAVNAGGLNLNGLGGTLNLGDGLTHTFTGTWTRTNGTLNGGTSTVNFSAPGAFISGSIGSFIPNGGTVNYSNAGAQTVGQFIYNNLTLSGGGIKTTTSVTVNEILSLEGTATVSAAITYGTDATLQYNKAATYTTTNNEFPATFSGSGGVNILGAGTIIFNAAKTITGTLTIASGSTVDLNTITAHSCNGLVFDLTDQFVIGTYGRTGSGAANINDVFFASATSGTILLNASTSTWLGVSFDWSDPINWSNGIPSSITDVVIPSGVTQPILTAVASSRNLTINTSATITSPGFQLSIFGNFVKNGSVVLGGSPVVISGTSNQSIASFTTTGNVSVTKLGGVATLTGDLSVNSLTINGIGGTLNLGSGFTHTISGNLVVSAGTLTANTASIILTGTSNQNIAGFTTTGTVTSTKSAGTATLTGNISATALNLNVAGGTINLGTSLSHTISGNIILTNGTLNGGSSTLNLGGNISGAGTFTGNACNILFTGASTQGVVAFTTTGNISNTKTGGTVTLNGNVDAGALTINGPGSTLSLGTSRTHTFTGDITLTAGTLSGGNNTLNVNSSTPTAWTGTGSNFTAGTSTVVFGGGAQTINTTTTFNNLTLGGTGAKTFASGTTTTINGIHQIANGTHINDFTGATIAYGPSVTLRYNAATASRTTSTEWPSPFLGTGGVIIDGDAPGVITLNAAKQIGNNTNIALTINAGATLATNNFGVTFYGNFVNSGTFTGGSSPITLDGTFTQSIGAITTTGNFTTTKTSGTATFTGNIIAGALSLNGLGSTLNLGAGRTHTFNGDISLTAGTLNGGSSIINANSASATAWNGTGSNFVHATSTVVFGGANQTIATNTNFNNLTMGGTGTAVAPAALGLIGNYVSNQNVNFTTNTCITTFNGTLAQTISGSIIPTFNALTINNTLGVSTSVSSIVNGTLTLTAGTFNINSDSLTLGASISRTSGNINAQNGKVRMAGSGAQTIPASTFVSNTIRDLTVANAAGVTLGGALSLTNVLTPELGSLATGGNLTLISTSSATASIANGNCTSCSYISGNVNVQRNIPSVARRWRFVGSPVTSATLNDWKNEVFITGVGGAANGFDASLANQASVFAYDESITTGNLNTGWTAATNITNSLVIGKGYRLFIRGDRSDPGRLTGTVTTQNEVTMDLVGTPNQGDIVMPVTFNSSGTLANDGWNLLSNPYPSPYNWNAHFDNGSFQTNIEPTIHILSAQTGGYISYNATSNAGTLTDGIIPSGASFWVKATAGSPSVTFKEQFKVATAPIGLFKTEEGEAFSIKLSSDSINSDELLIKYMALSTPDYDTYDTRKLAGSVNISAYGNDNTQLALSVRPTTLDVDTIKLNVSGVAANYTMDFANSQEIAVKDNVFLIDTYLTTVTDLKVTSQYPFAIESGVPASQGLNRFYIVVGNTQSLPVKLLTFAARKVGEKSVQLNWATAQETNNEKFVLEHSEDAKIFEPIATVKGNGTTQRVINYSWIDTKAKAINYYRLKQVDYDGTFSYSKVVRVDFNTPESNLKLYPMPMQTALNIESKTKIGFTSYKLINTVGQIAQSGNLMGTSVAINVDTIETGVYVLQLINELGETITEKVVKE